MDLDDLVARLRAGETTALARALTLVENRAPERKGILAGVFPPQRRALIVGLTGPPGVGKSTLADRLAKAASVSGRNVGYLAIDPTSPFSGGALLGDRARLEHVAEDPSVFVRSMATRGHVGGLASAAFEALVLLEAAGKDFVLVETVGAGQDEVEVAAAVDVTLVVLAPGLGDEIQAAKAGMLEIADLFVVNKCDRDGGDRLAAELAHRPVHKTVASRGEGVEELLAAVVELERDGGDRRRRFFGVWLEDVLQRAVRERLDESAVSSAIDRLLSGETTPYDAADDLLDGPMKIHHVGIAVRSVEEAARRFGGLLGLARGERYEIPEFGVVALFLPVGGSSLELLEPLGEASPVGKFLDKRGEGIHHICFEVENIEASLEELARQGATLIDEKPRPGAGGHLVAFVHPRSTHGVLVELKQR